jgi:Amt family ammonium transporter
MAIGLLATARVERVMQRVMQRFGLALALTAGLAAHAGAAEPAASATPAINSGDTAWMLVCTGLVLLMTPGLACFYGGLVRRKNVLGTMMQSFAAMALIGVLWVLCGYTLAFGPTVGGWIGGLKYLGLRGVGGAPHPFYAPTTPHLVFMAYQGMFAIITPALIGGAVAERMKFSAFFWFMALWSLLVYCPLAHWVWADGGWLMKMGVLDFAGGTVVHISCGVAALVACLTMGRRADFPSTPIIPHSLPLVLIGGGLLWFGWFGFNGGSAYAANGIAAGALVATHVAAAAGALAWMVHDWVRFGKPTALGMISGSVAGLGSITPASGFVTPVCAMAIGAVASIACANFVQWRNRKKIDDSLDTYGVHGIGGTIGTLLAGVLAMKSVNPAGSGLIDGNGRQVVVQLVAIVATYVFVGVLTFVILKFLDLTVGLRVDDDAEAIGLDQTQHGEEAYTM